MLYAHASVLLACASLVAAFPVELPHAPAQSGACKRQSFCDVIAATMPLAPTPLPPPDGLTLFQVAIGRGTQNYTCDLTNATAVPASAGALASLFDVSCVAATSSSLLNMLPRIALDLPDPNALHDDNDIDLSGHHYFLNNTTPYFNMNTPAHQYGAAAFSKTAVSDAPINAMAGQSGKGGNGAVQWLYLEAQPGQDTPFKAVYRLNTQGGDPPATCTGMPASFDVQYAAEYWIYS